MKEGKLGGLARSSIVMGIALLIQWLAIGAILYGHYYVQGWDGFGWILVSAPAVAASFIVMVISSAIGRPWGRRPIERLIFWLQMPTGIPILYYTFLVLKQWITD